MKIKNSLSKFILLGLFAYLFYIDKKLSRIEKNQQ